MTWPTKKLAELLDSFDAGTWGKPASAGKGLLVLRSTNITNGGNLDFSDVAELDIHGKIEKLKLLDGDILLEKSGGGPDQPVGRVVYFVAPNHRAYSFANFIQRLRVKPDLIDGRFLFYRLLLLHKIGFTKKLQSQTTGIRNLKLSLYLKTEIPLPPLSIQKQIIERMDKITEAQKLNDDLIQKSDELFQSLLYKELVSAGRNWEVKKLGEISEIIMGQSPPSSTYNESGEGLPFFQGKAEFGEIYPTPVKYCPKPTRIAEANDILMSVRAPVGNINLAKEKSGIGRGLGAIRARKGIDQSFLYFFFIKNENSWSRLSVGSTFSAIRRNNLDNLEIPIPPIETQKQIVAKLSAAQEYKKQLISQKAKLKELFDSVLHKSMGGTFCPSAMLRTTLSLSNGLILF